MNQGVTHFDHIVVGGGTAGCVVAGRLAERRDRRVLLLEAGPRDHQRLIRVPAASAFVASRKATNWSLSTTPQPTLDGRALYLAQARVLGGGSSINGMVYTRGSAADYDDWCALGADGWGYEDVLPHFRRSEKSGRGAGTWHGGAGPLRVQKAVSELGIVEVFLEAARQAGFARVDDLNTPDAEGIGPYDWMIGDGRRASTALAFLRRQSLSNLTVLTGARATRVHVEHHRAVAVSYLAGGRTATAHAEGEIVLTAGAIFSPQLLMISGIGPADELRRAGIEVIHHLPQVGENLHNHLSYKLMFSCDAPITAYRFFEGLNGPAELWRYLSRRRGFLANGSSPAGGFFRSGDGADRPDMQLFMAPLLTAGIGSGLRAMLPSAHGITFFVNQGRPYSRGRIRLASSEPLDLPLVDPEYLSDPRDLPLLIDGIERVRRIAVTEALRGVGARELRPGAGVRTRESLAADLRARAGNHFHVAGTCRIGRSASDSVVDPRLSVHGIDALRVADASVMPAPLNANTAAPVIMIAERAAEFAGGSD